jgi:hypothetical protein
MYVMYYVSMLQCWQFIWILVKTNHPFVRVGRHRGLVPLSLCGLPTSAPTLKGEVVVQLRCLLMQQKGHCSLIGPMVL